MSGNWRGKSTARGNWSSLSQPNTSLRLAKTLRSEVAIDDKSLNMIITLNLDPNPSDFCQKPRSCWSWCVGVWGRGKLGNWRKCPDYFVQQGWRGKHWFTPFHHWLLVADSLILFLRNAPPTSNVSSNKARLALRRLRLCRIANIYDRQLRAKDFCYVGGTLKKIPILIDRTYCTHQLSAVDRLTNNYPLISFSLCSWM